MDYCKGKDLDRVVHVLQASGERFTETQILDIGCQVAMALEFCHNQNILHQDRKPMNVLHREHWNSLLEPTVPELCVSDFELSSRVRSLGTRMTFQRGTPSYEEIQGGPHAEFSQKSDVYALGCILYRLCTLDEPDQAVGKKPNEIPTQYSIELRSFISTMLRNDRFDRPTATQVKKELLVLIRRYFNQKVHECRKCRQLFDSNQELRLHLRRTIV